MQCPSCGFQNMPGIDRCALCSTSLAGRKESESVVPPRAKDRTIEQRLRWSVSRIPGCSRMIRRFEEAFPHRSEEAPAATCPAPSAPFPRLPMRSVGLVLLAVIPGFGHIFVLHRDRQGLAMFALSLVWLGLAAAVYWTLIADLLVFSVIVLSMVSVGVTMDTLRRRSELPLQRQDRQIAFVCLMVLATYLGGYATTRVALSPVVQIYTIQGNMPTGAVSDGDTVLVWRLGNPTRGDIVIGSHTEERLVIGPVVGMPGDRVSINGGLQVNGRAVGLTLPPLAEEYDAPRAYPDADGEPVEVGVGQYWVAPSAYAAPNAEWILNEGLVQSEDILGRVLAVVGPPAHRRIARRQLVTGE